MPDLYAAAQGKKGKKRSLHRAEHLGSDEQITTVYPVDKNSREGRQNKDRNLTRGGNKTQQRTRAR